MTNPVRFPTVENRTVVVGSTGSGKTFFGLWLLSLQPWRKMPWIIWDFKGDKVIRRLEANRVAKVLPVTANPPKRPGIYIIRPNPHELDAVDAFLWKAWKQENIGLYFDEGYMVAKSKALNAILTQGRSKHIPVITLAQRPAWLSRFVFSESEFYAIFRLNDRDDQDTVKRFVNTEIRGRRLPYHSIWYDAGSDRAIEFSPVPRADQIIARFGGAKAPNKRTV